jgi:hypothetical protein
MHQPLFLFGNYYNGMVKPNHPQHSIYFDWCPLLLSWMVGFNHSFNIVSPDVRQVWMP